MTTLSVAEILRGHYNNYTGNKGNYPHFIKRGYPRIFNRINMCYGKTFVQKVYNVIDNIQSDIDIPKCKYCHDHAVSFKNINEGFKTYCSDICANKDPEFRKLRQDAMFEKYGVRHALQSANIKDKQRETSLERYGATHNWSKDSTMRVNCENTMLQRYGAKNPMELDIFKQKISNV